jgi:SAM-dependent methyltransferase
MTSAPVNPHASTQTVHLQRDYYARTAHRYEDLHVQQDDEHGRALAWLTGLVEHVGARSVLDIGSGTGRALRYLKARHPKLDAVGIEPSAELRAVGHAAGIDALALVEGDATRLPYADNSFDIVCEFGVLHHIEQPRLAVAEMLRVARIGVFISDDNHFAAGSIWGQRLKRGLNALGLWNAAYRLRTGGKGYRISEGDGLSYPYSVFDDLHFVRARCETVQLSNTATGGPDLYASAAHVALFGRKRAIATELPQARR